MALYESRFGVPTLAWGILAIVFGVLIIAFPTLVAWLVGLGLIIYGVLALVNGFGEGRLDAPRSRYAPPPRL